METNNNNNPQGSPSSPEPHTGQQPQQPVSSPQVPSAPQVQPTQPAIPVPPAPGTYGHEPQHTAQHVAQQQVYGTPGAPSPGPSAAQSNADQPFRQPQQSQQGTQSHSAGQNQSAYQTPTASAPKKKSGTAKTFLVAFLGAALAVAIGLGGFGIYNATTANSGSTNDSAVILGGQGSDINASDPDATLPEAVAQKALPSVVNIDVYTTQSSSFPFGGTSTGELTETSLGSGVILTEDGYIITNYHVVEGAEVLEVTIGDDTYQAEIIGSDPSSDIAVIKAANASGLTPIEIGSSSDLVIGQWVMTIGSPFGLEQSVATGIVSATSRSQIMDSESGATTVYANLIQTDAAINPGNSGGALVDANGKLIGINTLITSYSGNYSGVGFAIPVDYAVSLAEQIISGESPTHAQLGVALSTVTPSIAQRYGLSVNSGAYVTQVYSDTGASQAGIEVGDIITKFNGENISSASDLMLAVRSVNPGETVSVELNRSGETKTVDVTLGSDAQTTQSKYSSPYSSGSSSGVS